MPRQHKSTDLFKASVKDSNKGTSEMKKGKYFVGRISERQQTLSQTWSAPTSYENLKFDGWRTY